jgi:hypothetical protein
MVVVFDDLLYAFWQHLLKSLKSLKKDFLTDLSSLTGLTFISRS